MAVIYTSGSTGAPKGTVLGGRGYVNLLRWYRERMGLGPDTRYLQILSLAFDAALKDILGTLLSGGCLVLSPTRYDPGSLAELIERYRVTALCSTPTMLYPVLEGGYERLASLRCVCVGGDATHLARVRPWFESEHCRSGLLHGYGPPTRGGGPPRRPRERLPALVSGPVPGPVRVAT